MLFPNEIATTFSMQRCKCTVERERYAVARHPDHDRCLLKQPRVSSQHVRSSSRAPQHRRLTPLRRDSQAERDSRSQVRSGRSIAIKVITDSSSRTSAEIQNEAEGETPTRRSNPSEVSMTGNCRI